MRVGLRLPSNGPNATAEDVIWCARLAEELGFDSLWVNDHIIVPADEPKAAPYHRLLEPFVTLAAVSMHTERVRLATGVLVLPIREPLLVAKQAATIDLFSKGRLTLGVGVGWEAGEFRMLNVDFERRGTLCDEWIDVVRAVWTEERIAVCTSHYRLDGGISGPPPAQSGGPPILIGGTSPRALRRAALKADGWLAPTFLPLEEVAKGIETIRAQAPAGHKGLIYVSRRPPEASLAESHAVDEMVRQFDALRSLGVQECTLPFPESLSVDDYAREITSFAKGVMPRIR